MLEIASLSVGYCMPALFGRGTRMHRRRDAQALGIFFFPFCPSLALAFLPVLSSSIPFHALNGRNLEFLDHLMFT